LKIENSKAKLLLHSCCAPCLTSSYAQTTADFFVVPFWFNPNIEDEMEYKKRLDNFKNYTKIIGASNIIINNYQTNNPKWHKEIFGLENEPEGGKRCQKCIQFRLEKTADYAKKNQFDVFGTTMTVSPRKNAKMINKIGQELSQKYKIDFLSADFKKNNGFLISTQLSKKFNLYRQNYCGCKYSNKELRIMIRNSIPV